MSATDHRVSKVPYTLLLVDDSLVNREMWSVYLAHQGYAVKVASNGIEALRAVEDEPIDLVLLDVVMPGIDGFEVLQHIRRNHTPEELPVIMATGQGASEDVVRGFEMGANDYVAKPLDLEVVLVRIQAQLRLRRPAAEGPATRPIASIGDVHPGTLLEGKYRLDELIDKGSFGVVYRATQLSLDRQVAIKFLATTLDTGETTVARFQQEGISTCRLQHPNAVSVLDFSVTQGGLPFLVMELLEGWTLDEELRLRGPLSPGRCAEIILPVCDVLAEAHAQGIIHRDIKPQNIFLHQSRQGEVIKVLDFGISKMVGQSVYNRRLSAEGSIVGTPAYMAPERISGDDYDGRSDVYSVGAVIYQAVSGRRPFSVNRGGLVDLIRVEERTHPPLLRDLRPELPEALESLVSKTLSPEADERPTAEELAKALPVVLGSGGVVGKTVVDKAVVGEAVIDEPVVDEPVFPEPVVPSTEGK